MAPKNTVEFKDNTVSIKVSKPKKPKYKCPFQQGAPSCPTKYCALYITDDYGENGQCAFRKIAIK